MKAVRIGLAVAATAAALTFGGGASAEESDACVVLDAQVAQFDASIAAQRAQLDTMDATLGPAYDAALATYRVYLDNAEVAFDAQVAAASVLFDCD